MTEEIIIAGFGGQGIIMAGRLLCYAGMMDEKHVAYVPSYGAEMRGGTANCSVVITDGSVACPVIESPSSLIILNALSLDKFGPALRPGGVLVYNKSLIDANPVLPGGGTAVGVLANHIAAEVGTPRVVNMVMLGAFLALRPVVRLDTVIVSLNNIVPERHHKLLRLNEKALRRGFSI